MLVTSGPGGALLTAADADLDALADRLHDGALQSLVAARYACDAVTRGADPVLARDAVQEALVTLRREVWLLRPRTEQGLPSALADLAAQLVSAGRAGLHLQVDPAVRMPPACVAAAYRLVQDLLGQTPLHLRLSTDGARVALALDAPLPDPRAWTLRADALGGELVATATTTLLLLPTVGDHL